MAASRGFYRTKGKRCLDLAIAVPATVLLAPLCAVIAGAVRVKMGTPVLFRQARPGRDGQLFTLLKFRSLAHCRDDSGRILPDDSEQAYEDARSGRRSTRLGEWLRATSLDELPELINVARGEMSLVGPRPLLTDYLPRYSETQMRRHEVLPGVTGWAQIHGRQAISFEERFELDVWYVDNLSFWLDMRILLTTLREVLARRGTHQPGYVTGTPFLGTAPSDTAGPREEPPERLAVDRPLGP